jgi:hypothetical protein
MAADPTSLLSDLLNAIKVRTDAAQKLADAVANQTKVSQEAARITKEANVALQTATTAQSSAHKALADALAALEGTQGTPTPALATASKIPPPLVESAAHKVESIAPEPADLPTA